MTIKATEVGREIFIGTSFNLSAETALKVKLTDPNGVQTEITDPRVTAPAVPSPDTPEQGVLAANTYMTFTTLATDFPIPGVWTVCVVYTDATPKEFHGSDTTFTVDKSC